jgi:hypothetical protein
LTNCKVGAIIPLELDKTQRKKEVNDGIRNQVEAV